MRSRPGGSRTRRSRRGARSSSTSRCATPGQLRYAGEGLAASGRVGRLEWSTDPFGVSGTAEEANVAGLRLTTRAIEPSGAAAGALARAEPAEEGGRGAQPAAAGGVLTVDGRIPFAKGRTYDLAVKGDFALATVEAVAPDARPPVTPRSRRTCAARSPLPTSTAPSASWTARGDSQAPASARWRSRGTSRAGRRSSTVRARASSAARSSRAGASRWPRLEAGAPARLHLEATDVDLSRLAVPASQRAADSPSFLAVGLGRPRGDGPAPRGPARRGAVHAARVEVGRGNVRPRRSRHVAPRRRAARAGDPPPRRAARDARGARRGHAHRDPRGLGQVRRPLRPAPREPVRARHDTRRPRAHRPPGRGGTRRASGSTAPSPWRGRGCPWTRWRSAPPR